MRGGSECGRRVDGHGGIALANRCNDHLLLLLMLWTGAPGDRQEVGGGSPPR
jgi:hypothetical protein